MEYYVYVLYFLKTKNLYIGHTNNLVRRLREHKKGYNRSTKNKGKYKLILLEKYLTREEAVEREKELKKGYQREKLKSLAKSVMNIIDK